MNRNTLVLSLMMTFGLTQAPPAEAMLAMKLEGGRVGNGGGLVVCRDQNVIKSVELLDFYEAKKLRGLELELSAFKGDWKEKAQAMIDRVGFHSELRKTMYSAWLKRFEGETIFLKDVEFSKVPDSGHVAVPKGCEFEQGAIQIAPRFAGDKRFYFNDELWQAMNDEQRAGLVLHEFIYREAIGYGHTDSISVRYLTGMIASKAFHDLDRSGWINTLQSARFEMTDLNYPGYEIQTVADLRDIWKPGPGEIVKPHPLRNRLPILLGTCLGNACEVFKEAYVYPELSGPNGASLRLHPLTREVSFDGIELSSGDGGGWDTMGGSFELNIQYGNVQRVSYPSKDSVDTDKIVDRLFVARQSAVGGRGELFALATELSLSGGGHFPHYINRLEGQHARNLTQDFYAGSCGSLGADVEMRGEITWVTQGKQPALTKDERGKPCEANDFKIRGKALFESGSISAQVSKNEKLDSLHFDRGNGMYEFGGEIIELNFDISKIKYLCFSAYRENSRCMLKNNDYRDGKGISELAVRDEVLIEAKGLYGAVKNQTVKLYPNGIPQSLIVNEYLDVTYEDGTVARIQSGERVSFNEKGQALR